MIRQARPRAVPRSAPHRGRAGKSVRSSDRRTSCRRASRTARPSGRRRQVRPVIIRRRREFRRQPQIVSSRSNLRSRSRRPSTLGQKLPRGSRQPKHLFWGLKVRSFVRQGQQPPIPSSTTCQRRRNAASRNHTVGAISASGTSPEGPLEQPGVRQRQFQLEDRDVVISDRIRSRVADPRVSRGDDRGRIYARSCAA